MEVTTEREDGVAVVALRGAVDADHAEQLRAAFGELLGSASTTSSST